MADIYDAIHRSYGSLTEPRWDFVMRAVNAEPYKDIIKSLEFLDLHIEDETSPGSDEVCISYVLSSREGSWRLMLSMVERLAALLRSADCTVVPPMQGAELKTRFRQV